MLVLAPAAARAETIAAALAAAYRSNPQLMAERARQRATDEQVPQAQSGWRPVVTADGVGGKVFVDSTRTASGGGGARDYEVGSVEITLSQPIFRGFKTVNGIRRAEAVVDAGRQVLLAVEQQILLDAATAFMNVIRDRNIVLLRRKSVSVLGEQLRASQARLNVGEITRTDVAQASARHAEAISNLTASEANLQASIANYVRIVGHQPKELKFPPLSPRVPKSLDEALAVASRTNPEILAASFNEEAARAEIKIAKGDLLPSVSLQASYSYSHQTGPFSSAFSEDGRIFGVVSVPLYEAGSVYSRVREAKQIASQRRLEILDARRVVREQVTRAWHILLAAGALIRSASEQISATELALDGVRQEAQVGTRTTLDVLDAEREYVNAQVILVTAQRDQIVAGYQLVAAIGRMTAADLRLSVDLYDPSDNYHYVRDKWIGTDIPGESDVITKD